MRASRPMSSQAGHPKVGAVTGAGRSGGCLRPRSEKPSGSSYHPHRKRWEPVGGRGVISAAGVSCLCWEASPSTPSPPSTDLVQERPHRPVSRGFRGEGGAPCASVPKQREPGLDWRGGRWRREPQHRPASFTGTMAGRRNPGPTEAPPLIRPHPPTSSE